MPNVLAFTEATHLLTTPMASGLPEGLLLQLWVRRTGEGSSWSIVELAGTGSKIVLGSGERGDILRLAVFVGDKMEALTIPGGLPIDRWVQVRAGIGPDGKAWLTIKGMAHVEGKLPAPGTVARTVRLGGFKGELAQVQVWRHSMPTALTWDPPVPSAYRLWAYYPLMQITHDVANSRYVAEDAGPKGRHATGTVAPTLVTHPVPFADGPSAHVVFKTDTTSTKLAPLPRLSGQVALEAWIRLDTDAAQAAPVIALQAPESQLTLVAGGTAGEVALVLTAQNVRTTLCSVQGLVTKGKWCHIAATALFTGNSLTTRVYFQGSLRASQNTPAFTSQRIVSLSKHLLIDAPVLKCFLGGQMSGFDHFRGGLAEARIWQTATRERLEAMWLTRARGNEAGLVACYRLDDRDPRSSLDDISPRRGRVKAATGVQLGSEGPPLAATTGATPFRLVTRGKLVREWVPSSALALQSNSIVSDILKVPLVPIHVNIFDATIEVRAHDGSATPGQSLEVRLDRPLIALRGSTHKVEGIVWQADVIHRVALPGAGRVRLRFFAKELACPTIRVRVAGAPGGVWTVIRPDTPTHEQLGTITGAALMNPQPGIRAPLPAGSSSNDAEALASACRLLGSQFAPVSSDLQPTLRNPLEDLWNAGTGALEDAGNALIDAGTGVIAGVTRSAKSAGSLLKQTAADIDALRTKASRALLHTGAAAISTLIDSADKIAISTTTTAQGWIEMIGTTIVNGVETAWRVVVSGIDEALTAIASLIKRIGAAIEDFIAFLAYLFQWADFLAASDEVYALLERSLSQLHATIPQLGEYKQKLSDALRTGVDAALGQRSVGDLFHLDPNAVGKVLEPLEYVLEKLQEALDSTDLNFNFAGEMTSNLGGPAPALLDAANSLAGKLPTAQLTSVITLLTTPLSQLLANNGALADGSSSVLDALFDNLIASGQTATKFADTQFQARLEVPWLTTAIEDSILGGRRFSIMRVVALVAGICGVLMKKSAQADEIQSFSTPEDRDGEWLLWASMALGLMNSTLLVAKTGIERLASASSGAKKITAIMVAIGGTCTALRGVVMLARVPNMPVDTRSYAGINAGLEMVTGAWTVVSAYVTFKVDDLWRPFDLVAYGVLGLATTATASAALATGNLSGENQIISFSLRCGSWVSNSMARLSEKYDDKDSSSRLKVVTMGLALTSIVVDMAEAIYGNYVEVEQQTG